MVGVGEAHVLAKVGHDRSAQVAACGSGRSRAGGGSGEWVLLHPQGYALLEHASERFHGVAVGGHDALDGGLEPLAHLGRPALGAQRIVVIVLRLVVVDVGPGIVLRAREHEREPQHGSSLVRLHPGLDERLEGLLLLLGANQRRDGLVL